MPILREVHFNPRAPYGARQQFKRSAMPGPCISIHAPHTGRDEFARIFSGLTPEFQSTRPIRGATAICAGYIYVIGAFQSTRPIRGATSGRLPAGIFTMHFNPRAPYGARRMCRSGSSGCAQNFNPRAPYGARPFLRDGNRLGRNAISIHAPHTGRDDYSGHR